MAAVVIAGDPQTKRDSGSNRKIMPSAIMSDGDVTVLYTVANYIELPLSGLEGPLAEMEQTIQDMPHRFAEQVLRRARQQIDALSSEEATVANRRQLQLTQHSGQLG